MLSGVVAILALVYLAFQVRNKRWSAVIAFFVIAAVMCGVLKQMKYYEGKMWCVCIMVAIIGSNVVALPQTTMSQNHHESFANPEKENAKTDNEDTLDASPSQDSETTSSSETETASETASIAESDDGVTDDHHTSNTKSTTETSKSPIDTFSTFMETYKSLTPDQIENMTSDTKDLIKTQKALMKTVQNLAPVISQGKEMMDTFKDYFGPSGTSDLMKAFKDTKQT